MFDRRGGEEAKSDEMTLPQLILLLESLDGERLYEEEVVGKPVLSNNVRENKKKKMRFVFFFSFRFFSFVLTGQMFPLSQRGDEEAEAEEAPLLPSEPHGEHAAHLPDELAGALDALARRLQSALDAEVAALRRELLQRRR